MTPATGAPAPTGAPAADVLLHVLLTLAAILDIGLALGILSPTLFAMLVLMALATTAMTGPAVGWVGRAGG